MPRLSPAPAHCPRVKNYSVLSSESNRSWKRKRNVKLGVGVLIREKRPAPCTPRTSRCSRKFGQRNSSSMCTCCSPGGFQAAPMLRYNFYAEMCHATHDGFHPCKSSRHATRGQRAPSPNRTTYCKGGTRLVECNCAISPTARGSHVMTLRTLRYRCDHFAIAFRFRSVASCQMAAACFAFDFAQY